MIKLDNFGGQERILFPEEVQAKTLESIKKSARLKANKPVTKCVITVPAYFDDNQKKSTLMSAEIAGLDCKAIINEPTAAAIAYTKDFNEENAEPKKVVIFDFGGGTFDVTILEITGKTSVVKAINGDTHLGG